MSSRIISPSSVIVSPDQGVILTRSSGTPVVTIGPSRYAVELRDKDGSLKKRLEHRVTSLSWEWNRLGGCGRATIKIDGDYRLFDASADDDIRIYLPNITAGATLVYRGYVEATVPSITGGNDGSITIECTGYFGWLSRIVVNDDGSPIVYTNTEVSLIVQDLIDDFLVGNADITRGTIDATTFTPDTISFKATLRDAIRTLFDLIGTVEYGINEDLEFFWYNQDTALRSILYLGDKCTKLSDRKDFKSIVNKIYFEGGDVSGSAFVATGTSQSSINRYGKHEEIISNGSISTSGVASRYMTSIFRQRSSPAQQLSIMLVNTTKRFESSLPMGAYSLVDPDHNQAGAIYGTTGAGGSNKIYGRIENGGSGQLYGGLAKHQIDRVQYTLSPQDGRVNAEVQFGNSISYSRASAALKKIELDQNAVRMRTL